MHLIMIPDQTCVRPTKYLSDFFKASSSIFTKKQLQNTEYSLFGTYYLQLYYQHLL